MSCSPTVSSRSPRSITGTCRKRYRTRGDGSRARYPRRSPTTPGYMAEKLSDRIKHFFTINEFHTFVDMGHRSDRGQMCGRRDRHSRSCPRPEASAGRAQPGPAPQTFSAHGLAVQAIRAKGKKGTKCGPAENINILVPLIETPEHIKAAESGHARN